MKEIDSTSLEIWEDTLLINEDPFAEEVKDNMDPEPHWESM